MQTIQISSKQLEDLWWPNSIRSKPSHVSFDLFNCFLGHHPHSQDAEHFFREFPLEKQTIFSANKCQARPEEVYVNCGKVAFFTGFWAQSSLDFIFFRFGKPHFLHGCRWVHTPGPVNSFCLPPFWQHKLQAIPVVRKNLLYTRVQPPNSPGGLCYFEVRGVVFRPWAKIRFLSFLHKRPKTKNNMSKRQN